jgi:hypothetical protein
MKNIRFLLFYASAAFLVSIGLLFLYFRSHELLPLLATITSFLSALLAVIAYFLLRTLRRQK